MGLSPATIGRRGADSFAAIDGPWRGADPLALTRVVLACLDPVTNPPHPVPGADAVVADLTPLVP